MKERMIELANMLDNKTLVKMYIKAGRKNNKEFNAGDVALRGAIGDVLMDRDPEAFETWLDQNLPDESLKKFFN